MLCILGRRRSLSLSFSSIKLTSCAAHVYTKTQSAVLFYSEFGYTVVLHVIEINLLTALSVNNFITTTLVELPQLNENC